MDTAAFSAPCMCGSVCLRTPRAKSQTQLCYPDPNPERILYNVYYGVLSICITCCQEVWATTGQFCKVTGLYWCLVLWWWWRVWQSALLPPTVCSIGSHVNKHVYSLGQKDSLSLITCLPPSDCIGRTCLYYTSTPLKVLTDTPPLWLCWTNWKFGCWQDGHIRVSQCGLQNFYNLSYKSVQSKIFQRCSLFCQRSCKWEGQQRGQGSGWKTI